METGRWADPLGNEALAGMTSTGRGRGFFVAALLLLMTGMSFGFIFGGVAFGSDDGQRHATDVQRVFVFASEQLRLEARFANDQVTIVLSDGRTFVLPQVVSASGARFADGIVEFWNKGDEAYLQLDGRSYTVRIVDAKTDVWERAKVAGVNFRAVGQEPGWLLEIVDDKTLRLSLDYGLTELTTPITSLETNFMTATRTYRTAPPWSPVEVTVVIEDTVCYDGMSGEGFTSSVAVHFPGSGVKFFGCGRDL